MTTLFPRGYGGVPSYQFSSPDQVNTRYYNGRYPRREVSFAPHYPTQPLYQPPFNAKDRYLAPAINQARQPGPGTELVILFNQLDEQYRYEQYLRQLEKMRKKYWRQQANAIPSTIYPAATATLQPLNPALNTIFSYEKETQYVPFPVYIQPGAGVYGAGRNLAYGYGSNVSFGTGGGMSLPPKVRVIFIPTGQSFSQQPYTGSLAMPPFLYNRISQPLCSFPLPPPLPQIGSLPLTPAVQQMVIQRYSNPIAVLPFSSNWQIPQMMTPSYPLASQQQQQSILPVTAFQSFPPSPQSYIPLPAPPPAPVLASPPFPPAPQAYIPPPVPPYAPISALQSLPPAPQAYIPPPPPTIPANIPVLSPPSFQLPLSNGNAAPSSPQYSYSGYPSMCRACPPAPPPLNIPVTGHCWVQHCCACHQVPTPISNPNIRPGGGRITPLLRHPTVPQYVPEQINEQQQQQYHHANAPVMMRPWLRKTPPLPPGGVLISDEYIDSNGSHSRYGYPPRQHRQHKRSSDTKRRSTTVTSRTTSAKSPTVIKNNRSVSPGRVNKNNSNSTEHQGPLKSKSTTSASSSSTSTSGLSAEYNKTTLRAPKTKQNTLPPQLTRESRNINLQYQYQTQELPAVYLLNRYLKSSSEASTLTSNVETRSDYSSPIVKELSPILSPSSDSNSIKKEPNLQKEDENLPRPPSQPNKPKEKLIIIREFRSNSPSILSTISSSMEFSIIDTDEDTLSTTSTIKANKLEGDDVLHRNIF